MSNYITLAEVKNYLKINSTEHDSRFANLITFACSVIESYCGRDFSANTYTEVFDGGTSSVFVKNIPINSVHEVLEYDGYAYSVLEGPAADASILNRNFTNKSVSSSQGFTLDSRYKKFGLTAGKFDGTSGYLSVSNSDDFWFDHSAFAIEGWFRFDNFSANQTLVSQVSDSNNYWKVYYDTSRGITFQAKQSGTIVADVADESTSGYTSNTFTHILVSRDETETCRIFRNGGIVGSAVVANSLPNISSSLELGRQNLTDKQYFKGHMEEIRLSLSSSRQTANFTPQTYAYSSDENTTLLLHFNGSKGSSSTRDSSGTPEQYAWYPETGEITRFVGENAGRETLTILGAMKFNNYTRGVKITYNGGYVNIPADIKLATLDYVKELHKGLESRAVSLQGESLTAFDFTGGFAPHIRRVLDLYRIVL